MKLQYFTSILLAIGYVDATALDLSARDGVVARNPQCHKLKRDYTTQGQKHSTPTPSTTCKETTTKTRRSTTTCDETTRKTTKQTMKTTTPKTTMQTTTAKTTMKTTTAKTTEKSTTAIITTKTTTKATTTSTCGTESAQCDPTGTAFPPCCTGQCVQGNDANFCRTSCLVDGSPCSLDHPEVCCGQVCLVDGYCITIV